jgi:hypothetical protein
MTQAAQLAQYGANNVGLSFKNRIINGDMGIDQRNAGASVATSSGTSTYTIDRWRAIYTQTSKFTVQQNAGSVTPPTGYTNYLGVTSSSAYSITSSDIFRILQYVEGLNCADLGWGTASASPVTLSFWVRSSLTGTFGGSFQNSGDTRSYPFTYTISSANTWEQKSVTIAGDTSGTWLTTNGRGIAVIFGLGVGSTYSGTAGAWASADYISATGATSVVGTNGATWYITGVQLEKGSVATSFDYLPYGTELMLCQRYYQTAGAASCGSVDGATSVTVQITEKTFVPMRASPSGSIYSGVTAAYRSQGADFTAASPSIGNFTCNGNNSFWTQVNGFSGLTSNAVVTGRNSQSANNGNFIALSAEL